MNLSALGKTWFWLALVTGFASVVHAQEDVGNEFAELEAAAAAKQLEEQEVAQWAIPFASGFAINGVDPESPQSNSIVVFNDGRVGVASGEMQVASGQYSFSGTNDVSENHTWMQLPFNQLMLLAIFKWIALSAAIGWPFVAFILRGTIYTNEKHDPTKGSRFYKFVGWVANVMVLVVMSALFLLAVRRPELWPGGFRVELNYLPGLVCGLIGASLLGLIGVIVSWTKGYWRIPGRLHYAVTILSALGFIWYLSQTGLLRRLLEQIT